MVTTLSVIHIFDLRNFDLRNGNCRGDHFFSLRYNVGGLWFPSQTDIVHEQVVRIFQTYFIRGYWLLFVTLYVSLVPARKPPDLFN
jgi:hypothetical protein